MTSTLLFCPPAVNLQQLSPWFSCAQSIASWLVFIQKQEKCSIPVKNGGIILANLLVHHYSAITGQNNHIWHDWYLTLGHGGLVRLPRTPRVGGSNLASALYAHVLHVCMFSVCFGGFLQVLWFPPPEWCVSVCAIVPCSGLVSCSDCHSPCALCSLE